MSYLEWNAPDQPTYFTYNDAGDIVGYHGSGVNGYVKCPIHGYYPTTYGAPNNAWTIRCKCPKCLEAELLQKKLNAAAIPRRFLDRSLSTFEVTKDWQRVPYETIKGYIEHLEENFERGRCIVMCGLPGTGKTHLAISGDSPGFSPATVPRFAYPLLVRKRGHDSRSSRESQRAHLHESYRPRGRIPTLSGFL